MIGLERSKTIVADEDGMLPIALHKRKFIPTIDWTISMSVWMQQVAMEYSPWSSSDWDSFLFFSNDILDEDAMEMLSPSSEDISLIPTPVSSSEDPDSENIQDVVVSVSTVFHPGAAHFQVPADLILLSCDNVFFYIHSRRLLEASSNKFNSQLPVHHPSYTELHHVGAHQILLLPESAQVLNIVLHTVYSMPCGQFSPSSEFIIQAVYCLKTYGFPVRTYVAPTMPLYNLILSRYPLHPIEFYTVAAENDLSELAVAVSSHLLAFNLSNLTDDVVSKIGPVYLKRLFFLHLGRNDALKRLLLSPPTFHGSTMDCDFTQQKKLTRAWALAAAYLVWDAKPDLSTSAIEFALGSLQDHLTCELCQETLRLRIKHLVIGWSNVKRTV